MSDIVPDYKTANEGSQLQIVLSRLLAPQTMTPATVIWAWGYVHHRANYFQLRGPAISPVSPRRRLDLSAERGLERNPVGGGGSIYRISHTGYRTIYTVLAGNPTSDAYNFCAAGAGEAVAYVAQPAGAISDLTATTFTPPANLPYGASHYAIRYGYYPRDLLDDPVQACDSGCTLGLNRVGAPAWFQNLYLDADRLPLAIGDAQMLAGQ